MASLGKTDPARCEKVANAVEARLSIDVERVVGVEIERAKVSPLRAVRSEILVEHLFPARGVQAGGVGDHAVEVEQDRIEFLAADLTFALALSHRSLPCCRIMLQSLERSFNNARGSRQSMWRIPAIATHCNTI